MKSSLSAFFAPADPVVAVHDTEEAVDSDVRLLGRAGYPGRMLHVVGRPCPLRSSNDAPDRGRLRRWSTSGAFWGLVWVAIALIDSSALARHLLPFGAILMSGALMLAIQTAVVCSGVAPERSTQASWRLSSHAEHPGGDEAATTQLLLVVKGSRSEVALARSLLGMRGAHAAAA